MSNHFVISSGARSRRRDATAGHHEVAGQTVVAAIGIERRAAEAAGHRAHRQRGVEHLVVVREVTDRDPLDAAVGLDLPVAGP